MRMLIIIIIIWNLKKCNQQYSIIAGLFSKYEQSNRQKIQKVEWAVTIMKSVNVVTSLKFF